jgi:hypothetical protein
MTGCSTPENTQEAIAAGADVCLSKPIKKVQFLIKAIVLGDSGAMKAHGYWFLKKLFYK